VSRRRDNSLEMVKHVLMAIVIALVIYPYAMLIILSFKNNNQFYSRPWVITFPLHFGNYGAALEALVRYVGNSLVVTSATCFGVVLLSAFSAYVFARFEFRGKQFLFYAIISLMMIPGVLGLVPRFVIVKRLGLLNTYWALILPYIAAGQVMGIFLLRTFFESIPKDLFDAAKIDGAGDFRSFSSVAVPLCKPTMATVAIINVQFAWNDLIWPLVVISDDKLKPLTIGLLSFQSQFATYSMTRWGPLFAGYVVASIPLVVLFMIASRAFVEGLTTGALKA